MTRYGWWENTVTTHSDLRAATLSALRRTVDVDEDAGVAPAVSLMRVSGGVGRNLAAVTASLADVHVRTTPRGWELTAHPSLESRRTSGYLREVWDLAEELLPGRAERVLVHVLGPWSMGAQLEYRGHSVIADRPAFKDMALTMGEALREYAERLGTALGAEVSIAVHEPEVGAVIDGLPGATRFDGLDPVDPEIITGVWRRFVGQVGVPCVLTCDGAVPDALIGVDSGADAIGDLRATGFCRIEFPFTQLDASTAVTDAIGSLVGEAMGTGVGIGVSVPDSVFNARSATAIEGAAKKTSKNILWQWSQWTLPPEMLSTCVDVTVPEGIRTPEDAICAAAIARCAAHMLRNY